ncbi:MAG TPA: hypothetical protein VK436_15475 [Methanocella sp.]|nr:hypothetical protein [Methanocella sp.]
MLDEMYLELVIAMLVVGLLACFLIMYIMYARIKQLVAELRVLKNRVEVNDEELTKLADDIEEFKKLKF